MTVAAKPLVLICMCNLVVSSVTPLTSVTAVTPFYGHVAPLLTIGKELVARGYNVTFTTSSAYKETIEAMGATLVAFEGYADFTEKDIDRLWPTRNTLPPGPAQLTFDMENCFIDVIPYQHATQQKALKKLADEHPGSKVILLNENVHWGTWPILLGAPGIRPTATIGIGIIPVILSSVDVAAIRPGLPPDSSPEGRERNKAMWAGFRSMFPTVNDRFVKAITSLGAEAPEDFFFDVPYKIVDCSLQMCIPSVEYPRSDAPSHLRFAGGLPKSNSGPWENPPAWWDEVTLNEKGKKIVAVSQGSLALQFEELVIPTMKYFEDRDDVLVVVALGRKGLELPADTIPANARVADYIPFDELLPHTAVFITNGGYGAFQHAIKNGVPLIVAGVTEDKPEVAARAEWAGSGINLRTATPTKEQLVGAVDELLTNDKYKKRALELKEEMANWDPMGVVSQTIEELAAGTFKK